MKRGLGEIFYLFAYGVIDLSHLVVLIIFETINVIMTVDASCRLLLLFPSGSSQESMLWSTLPLLIDIFCPRRDFDQKAKSRGGTLVTYAYIKESTYS